MLTGSIGNDTVTGADGNDIINAFNGTQVVPNDADSYSGGAGFDTVSYSQRAAPVTVTLDDSANDGSTGEGTTSEAMSRR